MIALDGVLDRGYRLTGGRRARYRTATLDAAVNWSSPQAYRTPGAPPNGSDYIRLARANGTFLRGSDIRSIAFDGSAGFPRRPVEWRVDTSAIDHSGDPALHSGSGGAVDRGIVRRVTVPRTRARLTFTTRYDLAPGLDFAFVQVSRDGGKTWRSLRGDLTTTTADARDAVCPGAPAPRLTGRSEGWTVPSVGRGVVRPRRLSRTVRAAGLPLRHRSAGLVPRLVDRQRSPRSDVPDRRRLARGLAVALADQLGSRSPGSPSSSWATATRPEGGVRPGSVSMGCAASCRGGAAPRSRTRFRRRRGDRHAGRSGILG